MPDAPRSDLKGSFEIKQMYTYNYSDFKVQGSDIKMLLENVKIDSNYAIHTKHIIMKFLTV